MSGYRGTVFFSEADRWWSFRIAFPHGGSCTWQGFIDAGTAHRAMWPQLAAYQDHKASS